jgi:hypothetical protein
MYNKLKTLLRKVDFYLRNEEYRDPSQDFVARSISFLFDDTPDPWRTRVYWSVRRTFKSIWDFPSDTYYRIKYAHQRLTRGWDDRVVWSVDWWLNGIMPDILRQLKENQHGIPMEIFLPEECDEWGNPKEGMDELASARWDAILDKMIAGFEASARICGHDQRDGDKAIFEEGMALFVKHYHSLWD